MITIALPNLAEFKASLDDVAGQQLPYAVSRTQNELMKLAQIAVRRRTGQIWHVRRQQWVDASVKIVKFSTKYDLVGQIGIHALGDEERTDILTKFEDQTTKSPFKGSHVVVPIGINSGKILREGQRFSDYTFVRKGNTWHDDARRAFIVPIGDGKLLVLQRVDHRVRYKRHGKAASIAAGDAQPLFLLTPIVHITPNLEFEQTVRQVVEGQFDRVFTVEWANALATAK